MSVGEYSGKFVDYYDILYSKKDYVGEADCVMSYYAQKNGHRPSTILDVGSGTGNHAARFSENGAFVIGIEPSWSMCSKALSKNIPDVRFYCMTVEKYSDLKANEELCGIGEVIPFDLATSLFNVVNHLSAISELEDFFSSVAHISDAFVFDCWNEIAVSAEAPKQTSKKYQIDLDDRTSEIVTIDTFPIRKSMESVVVLNNKLTVKRHDWIAMTSEVQDEFLCSLKINLWTPKVLKEIAQKYFKTVTCGKWLDIDSDLELDTQYKLMFYCEGVK